MLEYNIIHIGKCAGSTICYELKNNNIKFKELHLKKIDFKKNDKYIILLRNPIERLISAFFWRKKLVYQDKSQLLRFRNEYNILKKIDNIHNLILILENDEKFLENNYIHHIKENIKFYLENFLKNCKKENIHAVICKETIREDMKNIFNIEISSHLKKNKNDIKLSDDEYNFLKKYLSKDYECIDKLNELGCLTEEKYKILSK